MMRGSRGTVKFIALILGLAALVFLLQRQFPSQLDSFDRFNLFYNSLLLVIVGGGVLFVPWERASEKLRHALVWLGIFLVVVMAYSFRGELMPTRAQNGPGGSLILTADEQGHFYADASIGGVTVRFLVDTGASGIVLSPRDAERLGFKLDRLDFNQTFQTANGYVRGANVALETLSIGDAAFDNLPASVNGAAMEHSLLGMTFLRRLQSYQVEGRTLTLTP